MKRILVLVCLTVLQASLKAQVSLQTNLPKAVALNSEVTFDVKIKKGNTSNFAKYQMEVPREVLIKEVDSKSGSFTFEENVVKIIWVIAPSDPEVTISLKLITGVVPGKKLFTSKYFYVENDNKKQVETEPLVIAFKDSVSSGPSVSTSEMINIVERPAVSLLTTTINAAEISTKNPALLIQQVLQLKKDSRDAFAVGEREKKKAETKLAEANDAMEKANALTDENEKKAAQEKASQAKVKAENDMEVAVRVLALAKSLEDNANEIDAINRSVNPDSYSKDPKIASNNTPKTTNEVDKGTPVNLDEPETENGSSSADKKSKKKKEKEAAREAKEQKEAAESNEPESGEVEKGLVYKVQLGAFSKEPSKRDFKSIGKVKISQEDGMYKVLHGSYSSKEEAFKKREEAIGKGFDAFVVSYRDGVRVK